MECPKSQHNASAMGGTAALRADSLDGTSGMMAHQNLAMGIDTPLCHQSVFNVVYVGWIPWRETALHRLEALAQGARSRSRQKKKRRSIRNGGKRLLCTARIGHMFLHNYVGVRASDPEATHTA